MSDVSSGGEEIAAAVTGSLLSPSDFRAAPGLAAPPSALSAGVLPPPPAPALGAAASVRLGGVLSAGPGPRRPPFVGPSGQAPGPWPAPAHFPSRHPGQGQRSGPGAGPTHLLPGPGLAQVSLDRGRVGRVLRAFPFPHDLRDTNVTSVKLSPGGNVVSATVEPDARQLPRGALLYVCVPRASAHAHSLLAGMHCGVWCGVVWCAVLWCAVVWCGVVWRCAVVWCAVLVCGVVWCVVLVCGVCILARATCRGALWKR
jgi:hypothetical protein